MGQRGSGPGQVGQGQMRVRRVSEQYLACDNLIVAYKILAKALSLRLQPMLDTLIHPTQTGFVKGRSILDNIFTYWEAVSLAHLREEPLAVLLLDFEKAYDHVDWAFLEAMMLQMGFPEPWIRGMATLYRSAHSQELLAKDRGERFSISRSV